MILGIDPGKDGALVLLDGGRLAFAARTSEIASGRWETSADAMADVLRAVHAEHRIRGAVLELHAGRPGEGGGSARTVGVGWGLWRGTLAALKIETRTPASAAWTRDLFRGVPGEGKERAASVARGAVPDLDLRPGRCKKDHDGLADAACLALWGERFVWRS